MKEVSLINGWLIPSEKVSFNNTPLINLSLSEGICHYSNTLKNENSNNMIEKRKMYYITFDSSAKWIWYYQYEKDAMHDFHTIKNLIMNIKKKDSI